MRRETGKKTGEKKARCVLAGVCLAIFLITLAVVLVLNARWIYELDISWLGLERASGMSAAEIRANYHALIDYNCLFFRGSLVFPTLPMSEEGAIHFREVKRIFDMIQIACIVSGLLSLILLLRLRGSRSGLHFGIAGILSVAIPVLPGILVALDWERFFVGFHQLVFRNDYWLFDPVTDPVILILPDTYFLQCAAIILFIVFAGAAFFLVLSVRRRSSRLKSN